MWRRVNSWLLWRTKVKIRVNNNIVTNPGLSCVVLRKIHEFSFCKHRVKINIYSMSHILLKGFIYLLLRTLKLLILVLALGANEFDNPPLEKKVVLLNSSCSRNSTIIVSCLNQFVLMLGSFCNISLYKIARQFSLWRKYI